ncbi:MAG: 3-dehydroquinate synthase [Nitrospiraceae bacterium]
MSPIAQRLQIPVEYTVHFTEDLFSPSNPCLRDVVCGRRTSSTRRVCIVLDGGLAAARPELATRIERYLVHHKRELSLAGSIITVPGGERVKHSQVWYQRLLGEFYDRHLDRHSFVLVVGGGAVIDMAGFAAAITHRGVRLIRVPTTVLSQGDGGLGVKTGVNIFGVKNGIGTFTAPYAVINDADLLTSLPPRHLRSGMSEALKVALIRDPALFEWLHRHIADLAAFESAAMAHLIRASAEIHLRHIATSGDPFETGSARPLDFGHWSAHKLETLSRYRLFHGEAVGIGIAIDSRYSVEVGLLDEGSFMRIMEVLEGVGLPTWHRTLDLTAPDGTLRILRGLDEFQEHIGGTLTITLLRKIGVGTEVHTIDRRALKRALAWLKKRHGRRCVSA